MQMFIFLCRCLSVCTDVRGKMTKILFNVCLLVIKMKLNLKKVNYITEYDL